MGAVCSPIRRLQGVLARRGGSGLAAGFFHQAGVAIRMNALSRREPRWGFSGPAHCQLSRCGTMPVDRRGPDTIGPLSVLTMSGAEPKHRHARDASERSIQLDRLS